MLPLKPPQIFAAFSALIIVTWLTWSFSHTGTSNTQIHGSDRTSSEQVEPQYTPEEQSLLAELSQYGVKDVKPGTAIHYTKLELVRDISASFTAPRLQEIDTRLSGLRKVKSLNQNNALSPSRISVPIPELSPVPDASSIVFGVATDLERLKESLDGFSHWASGNGARIIASIQKGPPANAIAETLDKARLLNIDLKIVPNQRPFDDRYFALTELLHQNRGTAQWAALIDDDTFFPSMTNLLSVLSKYPAAQPQYIGSLSEDFFQIAIWGMIAYGGAGIFLSMPLLDELIPHVDACLAELNTGDKRLAICVLTYTTTRMTHENLLHQVDLKGDATGFYEALRPQPVSVHHWKSWNRIDIPSAALVSTVCGDKCIFQKYRFSDDWQLTNGVSLVKYSHVRDGNDIRMEKTWNDSRGQDQEEMFRHSLAPVKPKDPAKISFLVEGARVDEQNGLVSHLYIRRLPDEQKMEIVEVVWRKDLPQEVQH